VEVTEVRVRLAERKQDRLRAFCSVTFDNAFVVRDVKVIQGDQGLFVAMPSRKLTDRCPSCRSKNQLRARYCSECGTRLADNRAELDERGRPRLYVDVAHPISAEARRRIEQAILAAYHEEVRRSRQPGYRPTPLYEDQVEEPDERVEAPETPEAETPPPPPPKSEEAPPRPSPPPSRPERPRRRFGEGIFEEEEPNPPTDR